MALKRLNASKQWLSFLLGRRNAASTPWSKNRSLSLDSDRGWRMSSQAGSDEGRNGDWKAVGVDMTQKPPGPRRRERIERRWRGRGLKRELSGGVSLSTAGNERALLDGEGKRVATRCLTWKARV